MSKLTDRKNKRSAKATAKATGKPYQKRTRTKKGLPGEGLSKLGRNMIVAGAIGSMTGKYKGKEKGNPGAMRGLATAFGGAATVYAGEIKKSLKRNQPTEKPVTKKKRKGRITKTRHVTPTGVTRTKTKKYKKSK